MPALPAAQRERLGELGADLDDAHVIVNRGLASLVLGAISAGADANRTVTHAVQNLALDGAELLGSGQLASLVQMETSGQLTATQAKTVLGVMCKRAQGDNADPGAIAAELGFEAMAASELETLVDQVIAENPEAWEKFCAGDARVAGVFVGAVMKATRGQADGKAVNQLLAQRRDA